MGDPIGYAKVGIRVERPNGSRLTYRHCREQDLSKVLNSILNEIIFSPQGAVYEDVIIKIATGRKLDVE